MSDLKPLDQWTPEDHFNYKRQHNGSRANPNPDRGRPPLVGEGGPTREELAEAGLRVKADPNQRSPHAYSDALDGGRQNARGQRGIRNRLDQLGRELAYVSNARVQRVGGVPVAVRAAELRGQIAKQTAELAEAVEASRADEQERRGRLAEAERLEREAGPPPGHQFLGYDEETEWRFDDKGKPVARIGRRGPSGHDEAA